MQEICSDMCFELKPDSARLIQESSIGFTADNDTGYNPTNLNDTINVSFFLNDDFTCKRKFSIVLEVYKLADSDIEEVRDLNAKSTGRTASSRSTSRMCASRRASGSSSTC